MRPMKPLPVLLIGILVCLSPAFAHHSTSAEFDMSKTVAMTGTICGAEFSNPHTHIYVHFTLANGQVETWKLELPGMARMGTQGVNRDTFKPGESVTVQAYPSKAKPSFDSVKGLIYSACPNHPANTLGLGHVRQATLANGKQVQISDQWPETITVRQ
jgi:Family of unknown function (DUF6152)